MKLTYGDLLAELKNGARGALMIRHAERPHIDRTDGTRRYAYIQLAR